MTKFGRVGKVDKVDKVNSMFYGVSALWRERSMTRTFYEVNAIWREVCCATPTSSVQF